jgi:heme/copper-type cytochrome/quinol oxidase subunit 3
MTTHHVDTRPYPPDEYFGNATPGKIGMWIFLLSDAFMFGGLLLAYGILRGGADVWHHEGEPALGINFTAGLTFLLICSSVTMVLAYAAAIEKNRKQTVQFLALTALGGILFLVGQYYEYFGIGHPGLTDQGLHFGNSAYASTFYVVTSFHGCHVLTGVIILITYLIKTARGKGEVTVDEADEIEIVGLFWHFVDLIWILVFTLIYLL